MGILENPWFIGIGGGVLSGLVVTVITRYLFSRKDNREYLQRVVTANQEVLYAVRPGISEGVIPTHEVLESLIKATGQKYGVDHRDLHQSSDLADVLTKEVMDSSFLSASAKAEFCERLNKLKPEPKEIPSPTEPPSRPKTVTELAEYRQRMVQMMSAMLGLMAALMTASIGLLGPFKDTLCKIESKNIMIIVPTALTLVVALLATYATLLMRVVERKRRQMRDTKGHDDDDE
jgi:hypothetical protein